MTYLLALVLFAQTLPLAYTTVDPADPEKLALATVSGRYAIELGQGCDDIAPDSTVEILPGSGGVGAIAPVGSDVVCNVQVVGRFSDEPCVQNAAGDCDVTADLAP